MSANVIVLDVGKTVSKLSLWSGEGRLLKRLSRANAPVSGPGYAALDTDGITAWLTGALCGLAAEGPVQAIVPVGHGAAGAIVRNGTLVCPPLDYEQAIPAGERALYERERDDFSTTGSPALPGGLNLGAQLNFLERRVPGLLDGAAVILTWPQYWAWQLSGVAAAEVTSLGCHTDLWNPVAGCPSALAARRGWADRLPPVRRADAALGPITAAWAAATGLPRETMIYCGIHDSNAALLAARAFRELDGGDSTLLSTGTWFVGMRTPAPGGDVDIAALPADRDCLLNVDAFGQPIPSARFMGGREIETLTGGESDRIDVEADQAQLIAAASGVVERGAMALPSFVPGSGPFPRSSGRWIGKPADRMAERAAVGLYAGLMTDAALDLIGARDRILVEGRFARSRIFVRALAALRPDTRIYVACTENDVAYGALRLVRPDIEPASRLSAVEPLPIDLSRYAARWRDAAGNVEVVA